MAKKALAAVENGDLMLDPANFEKTWSTWLHNIR